MLLLIAVAGPALSGGGDWKMGPFGPYWDDNSWPEFTPMYWMEEFMNRLDDDDDEIQTWMLRNQFPGQASNGWAGTGVYPQYSVQPEEWTGLQAQTKDRPVASPSTSAPGGNTYIIGENHAKPDTAERETGPLPYLTPEEFARMPVNLQREFRHAFDKAYPIASKPELTPNKRPLPNLTLQEYQRMPVELQREYKRAFDKEYARASKRNPNSNPNESRGPLPRLTPQEYASMPAELQREYRQAFDRENSRNVQSPRNTQRMGLPMLSKEEFLRMPPELQQDYRRALDREYAEYQARMRSSSRRYRSQ